MSPHEVRDSCGGCGPQRVQPVGHVADVGRSSPMNMRMVVGLPTPFGPRNPVTVPGAVVELRECTAVVPP
jgi:hypothetical protein